MRLERKTKRIEDLIELASKDLDNQASPVGDYKDSLEWGTNTELRRAMECAKLLTYNPIERTNSTLYQHKIVVLWADRLRRYV